MTRDQTEAIVQHHLQALRSGDVEDILSDYADDAIVISNVGGATKGREALRELYAHLPLSVDGIQVSYGVFEDDAALVVWNTPSIAFGSDTFVMRDGRIVVQTAALHVDGATRTA